jgi:hypothetical protein
MHLGLKKTHLIVVQIVGQPSEEYLVWRVRNDRADDAWKEKRGVSIDAIYHDETSGQNQDTAPGTKTPGFSDPATVGW